MGRLQAAFRKRLAKARGGMGVSGAGGVAKPGWAQTRQHIPGGGSKPRGDYDFHPGKPPARPQPKAGVGNLPASGFPHRGYAHKAKPGKYPTRRGSITISPNPRKPKQTTFGGSVGDVERQHEHTYGSLPGRKESKHKDKRGSTAHHKAPQPKRLPKPGQVESGDWIRTKAGLRGKVVGEGFVGTRKWPAFKVDIGGGKLTAVLKEDAQLWHKGQDVEIAERGREEARMGAHAEGKLEPGGAIRAVRKAVQEVAKHRDARGSTAHHKRDGGGQSRRQLSVPEKHQLRIARQNAEMNPALQGVMGGPDIEESKKIIERLTGQPYKRPKVSPWTGQPYNPRGRDWQQRQQREEADIEQRHPKGRRARERLQREHGQVRNPWRR